MPPHASARCTLRGGPIDSARLSTTTPRGFGFVGLWGVTKKIEYHDMTCDTELPDAIRCALSEYGYRERALGICKMLSVDDADPERFMARDTARRDAAAATASEVIASALDMVGELDSYRCDRVSLPADIDRALRAALRAHSTGKAKPGTRSALRAAIASAISRAGRSETFAAEHAAAMVCYRQEARAGGVMEAFASLAEYADDLAAMISEDPE